MDFLIPVAKCLATGSNGQRYDYETETLIAHPLRAQHNPSHRDDSDTYIAFNWQNGGGYGEANDGLGITVDGTEPVSRSQVQAVAFQANFSNQSAASDRPTLTANRPTAVAFAENSRAELRLEGGDGATTGALKTGGGKPGQSYPAVMVETLRSKAYTNVHAGTHEGYADQVLRALRQEIGAQAFAQWGLGILGSFLPPEVLRQALHGCELRSAPFSRDWLVYCALPRTQGRSEGAMQSVREAQRAGCTPQGRGPSEQLVQQLGTYLSELSQPGASPASVMRDLRRADEGSRLLQQALDQVEEAWRSACLPNPAKEAVPRGRMQRNGECEGVVQSPLYASETRQVASAVRRLSPVECEFLQGLPRNFTLIPYRGKPAADGPRYRALGNGVAIPVVEWIAARIAAVMRRDRRAA